MKIVKNAIRRTMHAFGLKKSISLKKLVPEITPEEESLITACGPYTMTGPLRLWALLQSIHYIHNNNIEGDIVECGVWRGGNLMLAGLMGKNQNTDRKIWGFDTFAGMSEPTDVDVRNSSGLPAKETFEKLKKEGFVDWCCSPIDEVRRNFEEIVGHSDVNLILGKVEDTLTQKENVPDRISVLRLDTDWYESTKIELEVLYPRLSKGGVLILDDYGYWGGAQKAADEYFAGQNIWFHRIDETARLIIK